MRTLVTSRCVGCGRLGPTATCVHHACSTPLCQVFTIGPHEPEYGFTSVRSAYGGASPVYVACLNFAFVSSMCCRDPRLPQRVHGAESEGVGGDHPHGTSRSLGLCPQGVGHGIEHFLFVWVTAETGCVRLGGKPAARYAGWLDARLGHQVRGAHVHMRLARRGVLLSRHVVCV